MKTFLIFDSEFKKWYLKKTTGNIPPGTSGASGIILDKFLYVIFGHNELGNTSDVYRVSFHDCCWEVVSLTSASSPAPRDKLTAWQYENNIYTFGGYGIPFISFLNDHGDFFLDITTVAGGYSRGWNNQVTIFDPMTSSWSSPACTGQIASPRAAHANRCLGG